MSIGIDDVVDNIVSACQERKEYVGNIIKDTQELCASFSKERKEMAKKQKEELKGIKENLAKEFGRIKNDTKNMREGFIKDHEERKKDVENTLNGLKETLKNSKKARLEEFNIMMSGIHDFMKNVINPEIISKKTTQFLKDSRKERMDSFNAMMSSIKSNVSDINKNLHSMLNESEKTRKNIFDGMMLEIQEVMQNTQKEVEEIKKSTNEFLKEAEGKRITDYKSMMEAIQGEISSIFSTVDELQKDVHERIIKSGISKITAKPNKTVKVKAGKINIKVEKEESPISEKPADTPPQKEEKIETPIENKAASKEEIKIDKPLEDVIKELVEKNPHDGLRVGDMEDACGVSKLLLGRVAKEMYEAGVIRKVDGKYFPPLSFYK